MAAPLKLFLTLSKTRYPISQRILLPRTCVNAKKSFSSKEDDSNGEKGIDKFSSAKESVIDRELLHAASEVVKAVKKEQRQSVASDLLQKLRDHEKLLQDRKDDGRTSDFESMLGVIKTKGKSKSRKRDTPPKKFQQTESLEEKSSRILRSEKADHSKNFERRRKTDPITYNKDEPKLFEGKGLGIFTKQVNSEAALTEEKDSISLFSLLEREERDKLMAIPHPNAFEEEIHLTRQGKMWKFPVDNEEGLEEEKSVGFHEHVFLDHLLADMPEKGPVRHFMELVTVGLSKNPYITVQEKHAHIQWFKDYFKDKYHLLEDDELTQDFNQDVASGSQL